jgi:predicted  nucleic acid-binding Zn-ribbon protein
MALNEDTYRRLKREVETAQNEANRAQGALEQLEEELKSEFQCKTLEDAKRKLAQLQEDTEAAERKFNKALAAYEKNWRQE